MVLRAIRRRGEPLRPALAIDALLAAMRARFGLPESAANELLRPAFSDWRDAVGCADPILLPANAHGAAGDAHLIPIPLPSFCAWLVDAGVLRLEGPPRVEGPRVIQPASLAVVREAELTAVERFPILFAITAIPLVFTHVLFKAWVARFELKMKSAAQKLLVLVQSARPASKSGAGSGQAVTRH